MENQSEKWFEVWCVDGVEHIPAYLVIVAPSPKSPSQIIVFDLDKDEILYQSNVYEDVREWLLEDEFSMVKGRTFPFAI